jgi:hypothetical protein
MVAPASHWVAVYANQRSAELALRTLIVEGFAMRDLSVAAWNLDEDVVATQTSSSALSSSLQNQNQRCSWAGDVLEMLAETSFAAAPAPDPGQAVVVGTSPLDVLPDGIQYRSASNSTGNSIGALAGVLVNWGASECSAVGLEAQIRTGKFLIAIRVRRQELVRARTVLARTAPDSLDFVQPTMN